MRTSIYYVAAALRHTNFSATMLSQTATYDDNGGGGGSYRRPNSNSFFSDDEFRERQPVFDKVVKYTLVSSPPLFLSPTALRWQ